MVPIKLTILYHFMDLIYIYIYCIYIYIHTHTTFRHTHIQPWLVESVWCFLEKKPSIHRLIIISIDWNLGIPQFQTHSEVDVHLQTGFFLASINKIAHENVVFLLANRALQLKILVNTTTLSSSAKVPEFVRRCWTTRACQNIDLRK